MNGQGRIVCLIMFAFFISSCSFQKWEPLDKALFVSYTIGNVADVLQTREIMRDDNNFHEINPILSGLSRDQATGVMIGTNIGLYYLSDYFEDFRTPILGTANVVKWGLVIHNDSIGVEMRW